jgi:hypothetical protein
MKLGPRVLSVVIGLTVGLIGFDVIHSSRPGGPDPGQMAHASQRLDAQIERRGEVYLLRNDARRRVGESLLAGELTLFEAAAWFGYLNNHPPDCRCEPWSGWPGDSEGERLCRMVLSWIDDRHGLSGPAERPAVVERLKKELEEHIAQHGKVILPEL